VLPTHCNDIVKNDLKAQISTIWSALKIEIQTFTSTRHNKFAAKEDMPYLLPTKE
jgi:hypothetical protein